MGQLSAVLRNVEGGGLSFLCPGCNMRHTVRVGNGPGERWAWNGDAAKPAFAPSILISYDRWDPPVTPENHEEWRRNPWPQTPVKYVCHSFVGINGAQPGQIKFLEDCTHALAGQTVDLPNVGD